LRHAAAATTALQIRVRAAHRIKDAPALDLLKRRDRFRRIAPRQDAVALPRRERLRRSEPIVELDRDETHCIRRRCLEAKEPPRVTRVRRRELLVVVRVEQSKHCFQITRIVGARDKAHYERGLPTQWQRQLMSDWKRFFFSFPTVNCFFSVQLLTFILRSCGQFLVRAVGDGHHELASPHFRETAVRKILVIW
jgi:hypothetical protein